MYKYQEALDKLAFIILDLIDDNNVCCELSKIEDTFQELIDNQSDYMSYQDLKAEYEQKVEKLEKALDKSLDMYFRKGTYLFPSKEALKEYLLKESEKQ